jgi:hypothetical protein
LNVGARPLNLDVDDSMEMHVQPFARTPRLQRLVAALLPMALLNGCYVANQSRFEQTVHKHVSVGMPLLAAVANFSELKLQCTGNNPVVCSRIRQGFLYSCVERVELHWSAAPQVVNAINIGHIACAGL